MTILGRGDLSPARRRGRGRGRRSLLVVLVLALLGGGAYAGWSRWGPTTGRPTAAGAAHRSCHTPAGSTAPLPPKQVRVRVINGTLRAGLAATVRRELRSRGFDVVGIGNAPRRLSRSQIAYSAPAGDRAAAAAMTLHEQAPSAAVVKQSARGLLTLDIGAHWHGLAPRPAAARAHRADERAAHPSPVCTDL